MKSTLCLFMAFTGVGILGYSASQIIRWPRDKVKSTNADSESGEIQIIKLSDIAKTWCDPEPEIKVSPVLHPNFKKPEIVAFFEEVESRSDLRGRHNSLIIQLLRILDSKGDCPSVAQNTKIVDADNRLPREAYKFLLKIPLWQHSLEVTRTMLFSQDSCSLVDRLIVGLAHDIGKTESYAKKGGVTGDHPQMSVSFVKTIPEFNSIAYRSEIETAISTHHQLVPGNQLGVLLKKCDILVRNRELERLAISEVDKVYQ